MTRPPVAMLDIELPPADTVTRFTVQVEDGRAFGRWLVASLKTEGSARKRRLTYCLRCEGRHDRVAQRTDHRHR